MEGSGVRVEQRSNTPQKHRDSSVMAELQATLEFSVEYNKFYNVDLFQRGYYHIRTALKTSPRAPAKVEVTLPKATEETLVLPSCVVNGTAISKTFQILYRNEDVPINDLILYRLHTIVDSTKIIECLERLDLQVQIELWFSEEESGPKGLHEKMECVSTRTVIVHFNPTKGIHHHIPLLFDYFHLCALEVTIHGTLIAIHQPYISVPRPPKTQWAQKPGQEPSTLEMVYFGSKTISGEPVSSSTVKMHNAYNVHKRLCTILLSAYESLQSTFQLYLANMSNPQFKLEQKDCHVWLQMLVNNLQNFDNEEDLLQTATTDITQLCAENVIMWTQFLEIVSLDNAVLHYLAKDHHNTRVKRFAEGFFTHDYPKPECLSCYEPSYHGHLDLAAMVRDSAYFHNIPPLHAECTDMDGDHTTMPVIFEDIYCDHIPMQLAKNEGKGSLDIFQTVSHDTSHSLHPSQNNIARDRPYSSKKTDKLDKQSSTKSDSSMSSSQDSSSSPKTKSKTKKKFIKNIRPEAFRRPSSYSCSETENLQTKGIAADSGPECTLVGYRKKVPDTEEPVRADVQSNRMSGLGTFSPGLTLGQEDDEEDSLLLTNSLSMPSLLVRSSWSRTSITSLPDFDRKKLHIKQRMVKSELFPKGVIHSDPEITSQHLKSEKVKEVGSSSSSASPHEERRTTSDGQRSTSADKTLGSVDSDSGLGSQRESSLSLRKSDLDLPENELQKQKPSKFTHLADDITRALNENETWYVSGVTNNEDVSDDETCVANGYDEFLDHPHSEENYSESSQVHRPPQRKDNAESSSGIGKESSSLNESLSSQIRKNHHSISTDKNITDRHKSELGAKYGECEPGRETVGGATTVVSDTKESEADEGSTTSLSKDSGIVTRGSEGSDNSNDDRVTVIEFLRGEYQTLAAKKGAKGPVPLSQTMSLSTTTQHRAASDTNIHKSLESLSSSGSIHTLVADSSQQTSAALRSSVVSSFSYPELSKYADNDRPKLVTQVGQSTLSFVNLRENLKQQMKYDGQLYSEFATLASTIPYFHAPDDFDDCGEGTHLVICVHGLDGNSADLRLVKTYIETALPGYRLEFLMSERNQDTFVDLDVMTDRLESEIISFMDLYCVNPSKISFIGHSLGNLIIRSVISRPKLAYMVPKLYTFLSLSGPHLGTLYNSSGLVNMGMWFMQKWKKSGSLLQLSLKDHNDPRHSFLYKLSQKPGLEMFRHVLLVGSSQDRYVPYHSSRIEMCKAAQKESSGMGAIYSEMVANILTPVVNNPKCKLIRYDVFHALNNTANTIIGRAAHIAVLDSEIFIEKFMTVVGLKYFK